MSVAKSMTSDIISRFSSNDPYLIAEKEKIEIVEHNLSGRLKELYFGDYIVLKKQMPYPKKRHYLAHALGHHFLHTGNHLFFAQMRYLQNNKEEAQAEVFAAHLLIPDKKLIPIIHWNIAELADFFQVN